MSAGQSFNHRVTRPLLVMLITVSILAGAGLTLTKLRPSSTASASTKPSPFASASLRLGVNVLNGTTTVGLASQVSNVLASRGWQINQIGNWPGEQLQQTTVYYPAGFAELADSLAIETGGAAVLAPSNLSQDNLTLVLTK